MKNFRIPQGQVGLFAYGSLMSKDMHFTLSGTEYRGPFLQARLRGYRRSWTFAWPCDIPYPDDQGNCYREYILEKGETIYPKNLHFLNIREDLDSELNGVLFLVPEDELSVFDAYELGYERIDIVKSITDHFIEGGPVFAYRALPFFDKQPVADRSRNIIDLGYLERIRETLALWGPEFEEDYQKSTELVEPAIVREVYSELWMDPPLEKYIEFQKVLNDQSG